MSETGRRVSLDEAKQREICAVLSMGGTRALAARYVGCHVTTIRRTALRNEEFAQALERAESKDELTHLANINKAAKEGRYWRAAAWALERKYPDRYGQRHPNTFSIDQVSQVLAQFADLILEEVPEQAHRDRILERLSDLTAGLQAAAAQGAGE